MGRIELGASSCSSVTKWLAGFAGSGGGPKEDRGRCGWGAARWIFLGIFWSVFGPAVEGGFEGGGAFDVVVGGGFDGGAFAGGVLEVEEDWGGAGVGGEDLGDVFEVAFAVAGGPEHEFDRAFAVGGGAFGFEFGEFVSGEAAGAGAVVDLDGAFEFDGFSGIEEAGIAGGDEGFAPEHDFGGAGEVFEDEDAEGFAGFGGFGVEAADHAGEGVAFAGVRGV